MPSIASTPPARADAPLGAWVALAPTGAAAGRDGVPTTRPAPKPRPVATPPVTSWTAPTRPARYRARTKSDGSLPDDGHARWSVGLWSGTDRWENEQAGWEPGYEVELQPSIFSGELLSLSWGYGLSGGAALVATAAATRFQDVALADAFEDAEFAWVAVGIRFRF